MAVRLFKREKRLPDFVLVAVQSQHGGVRRVLSERNALDILFMQT